MSKVRVVTDSTADLPKELLEQFKITVVPLKVEIDGEVYRDGIDITPKEFYQQLALASRLPHTSMPAPGEFAQAYEELKAEGAEAIISILLSSELSGTYGAARLGKDLVSDVRIEVVDSRIASMGIGMMAIAAAKAAAKGASVEEILALIEDIKAKMQVFFLVDTLEYLQKGGRIGKAEAFLGSLLNIKPILTFSEGMIAPADKVRGQARAMERLVELIKGACAGKRVAMTLMHTSNFSNVMRLHERITAEFSNDAISELMISEMGPVLGTHVGPGLVGALFYPID